MTVKKRLTTLGKSSACFVIPKVWLESTGIKKGDLVLMELEDDRLSIRPLPQEEEEYEEDLFND